MSNSERILGIARRIAGMPPEAEADPHMVDKQVDSLDLTEIILEIEEEFDLIVEDEESIHTIDDLIDRVDALIA